MLSCFQFQQEDPPLFFGNFGLFILFDFCSSVGRMLLTRKVFKQISLNFLTSLGVCDGDIKAFQISV